MSKHILTRLRSLLGRAKAKSSARKAVSRPNTARDSGSRDAWLFESETRLDASRDGLAREMTGVANGLSHLRETLAHVHGDTPYPTETRMDARSAIVHHDDVLFEGEVDAPFVPAQEEVSGGAGMFLFDDAPSFQDDVQEHHQQAA